MSNNAFLWDFLFSVWGISVCECMCEWDLFSGPGTKRAPTNVCWMTGCTDDKHWLAGGSPPPRWPPVILVSGHLCPCVASSIQMGWLCDGQNPGEGQCVLCKARLWKALQLLLWFLGRLWGKSTTMWEARVERAEAAPEFLTHRNHEMINCCCCSNHKSGGQEATDP